ncbi:hypothetical protein I4U23_021465 [Adineta vaga]|nr:hypothetical protein I4U23_021465 [Adineta vaga]
MLTIIKKQFLSKYSCCFDSNQRLLFHSKLILNNTIAISSREHFYDRNQNRASNTQRYYQNNHRRSIQVKPMILKDDFIPQPSYDNLLNVEKPLPYDKTIKRNDLLRIINDFYRHDEVKQLATDQGLDLQIFKNVYVSFRKYCMQTTVLPDDFNLILNDIVFGSSNVTAIFPYFFRHAQQMFPHLKCVEDLKKISDLRNPTNWYPDARNIKRKIIFHAGPTNSGKTYHALQRFMNSESGVYCGPLKLLASEVFRKTNAAGTKCDLVTGEERRFADSEGKPANHVACTVEMTNLNTIYDVAVIDEIQMIRDPQRGWAWTRALLGLQAKEIHLCGEISTGKLLEELMVTTEDNFEIREYQRLTKLLYLDQAIETFDNVRSGDCIVCFNKNDIFHVTRELEKRGHDVAVIYGSLPPGTKLLQAQRFNDPNDECKILVATDAIGMGLNLSIKRVIFYSLAKSQMNEEGNKERSNVTTSQALQIAGRAGRFASAFPDGEVTTFRRDDLSRLNEIITQQSKPIERAGLHPTAEQIEMFAYYLPKQSLSSLIDIFLTLSQLDKNFYFMCHVEDMKYLADIIEHIPLVLRVRYTFSCAPINKKMSFVCAMFLKYAQQFSRNEPTTLEWLLKETNCSFQIPNTVTDLAHYEEIFDCFDLYLWLSSRFSQMFPDRESVHRIQKELDQIIHCGVQNIVKLVQQTNHSELKDDTVVKRTKVSAIC